MTLFWALSCHPSRGTSLACKSHTLGRPGASRTCRTRHHTLQCNCSSLWPTNPSSRPTCCRPCATQAGPPAVPLSQLRRQRRSCAPLLRLSRPRCARETWSVGCRLPPPLQQPETKCSHEDPAFAPFASRLHSGERSLFRSERCNLQGLHLQTAGATGPTGSVCVVLEGCRV